MLNKTLTDICYDKYQAILLDFDGTIYSKPFMAWHVVCREWRKLRLLLSERIVRHRMRGQYFDSSELFYMAFFSAIAKLSGKNKEEVKTWYFGHYLNGMVQIIRTFYFPRPEIQQLINQAYASGIKILVYSDYEMVEEKLQALGLSRPIHAFVSAPQLGGLKPAKEGVLRWLEHHRIEPNRCLVVGDRVDTDGATAEAIGCDFILIK